MDIEDQSQSQSDEPRTANDDQPPSTSLVNESVEQSSRLQIDLIDPLGLLTPNQLNELRSHTQRVFDQLPNSGEIRIRVVHDEQMKKDHFAFCDLNTTTDVLTFDLAHSPIESDPDFQYNDKTLDTDLTICFDEAMRQSDQRAHDVVCELVLYILHGTLHCLGYDDHSEKDFERMHLREDELLHSAGLGQLFYSSTSNTRSSEVDS